MRYLVTIVLALALAGSAHAQETVAQDAADPVDALLAELKRTSNEAAAARIAERIQRRWSDSDSATIDLLMETAGEAMREHDFAVALDLLDQVVVLEPGYAEGWNRRATVHFMREDYAKSMGDIARTLRLEPRHFGALAGMAQIFRRTGRDEMALDAYRRVLDVYPMLRSAQDEVGALTEELSGDGI